MKTEPKPDCIFRHSNYSNVFSVWAGTSKCSFSIDLSWNWFWKQFFPGIWKISKGVRKRRWILLMTKSSQIVLSTKICSLKMFQKRSLAEPYLESCDCTLKFSTKHFFGKYDQIRRKLRILSHLLKKFLVGIFFLVRQTSKIEHFAKIDNSFHFSYLPEFWIRLCKRITTFTCRYF